MILGQILLPRCGISSSQHQPLSPSTDMASYSKCMEPSLASARWLCWWRATAARVDLQSTARQQKQHWMNTRMDLIQRLLLRGMENSKGFGVYL
jgi:hypothetical protein